MKGVEPRGAVVAITGASAGIGWASALAFARAGSRLALAARRVDRLEALAAEIRALGSESLVMAVDVAARPTCGASWRPRSHASAGST